MEYKSFLIRYGEIGVRGKNRYRLEDVLVRQLGLALKPPDNAFHIMKECGRTYVDVDGAYDYEDTIAVPQRVFGVISICLVLRLTKRSGDVIVAEAVHFLREIMAGRAKSSRVFTRRTDKNYPGTSGGISASPGTVLLGACPNLHVDVRNPEIRLNLKIRSEGILSYALSISGPGGVPVGMAGHAMLLLSGGIGLPATGYMVAKYGVQLEAAYFHAPPYTSKRAKQKVVDPARIPVRYAGPVRLHTVNLMDIQLCIYGKCPREELTVVIRYYMMRIAEAIAKKNKGMALVTGEGIGQVASQAVPPLLSTNKVYALLVFYPLTSFDKQETIEYAEKVGGYETSILSFEGCYTVFVAKHPVTNPELSRIKKSKEKLAERIEELVETTPRTEETVLCEA